VLRVDRAKHATDESVGAGVALEGGEQLGGIGDVDGAAGVLRRLVV
jgi:hypothetical protein